MRPPQAFPSFRRFTWLFWMQPSTLHRLLRSFDLDPDTSAWRLLRRRRLYEGLYLKRMAQMFALTGPGLAVLMAGILAAFGVPVDWEDVSLGVGSSLAGGIAAWVVAGDVFGVAGGIAFGIAGLGASLAFAAGGTLSVAFGGIFGIATGVAFSVLPGALDVAVGVAGVLGVAGGIVVGVAGGVDSGLAFGLACSATFLRLPVLVLEAIIQVAARCWSAVTARRTLEWSPILYHELSYFPHPFLQSHLLVEADAHPDLTRRVLEACSLSVGQRATGQKVEVKLRARQLMRLAEAKDFHAIAELRGVWLPGIPGADGVLIGFSEAGRYLAAATAAFNPHHRLTHLNGFAAKLNALENQLRMGRDSVAEPFQEPLRALRDVGQAMRTEAEKKTTGLIPSPFRAFDPLSGETGQELFRGRETAVREIEETLSDPSRSASLQLLAPRRSGKTSLLKMLPDMLPDAVCVFFDLQAHPAASVDAFWRKLAEQAIIQAKRERRVDLPPLGHGPPAEAAEAWLGKLDKLSGGRRILIAIDEFERLEELFPGNRREFLQLMGLLRATIQHRRNVRLLVAGAAPFDELDRVWDDHFISARQIKLPFLDPATSVGLLTRPSPDFPGHTISEEVANAVYRRTGGQPFLLQSYGSLLVSRLNDEQRKTAIVADVQAVEGRVIEWAEGYFRDTYKSAPEAVRETIGRLARGEAVVLASATRRWLTQRYLLTSEDRLAIPVFGAWVEHHALL